MKLNKAKTTNHILTVGQKRNCTKLEMQNIVFPKWNDLGLMGMMIRQCVVTKEQPEGNIYNESVFQIVMRIIGGKVLMSGRPDCYCWEQSKVAKAKDVHMVGTNSAAGLIKLCRVLDSITDEAEKSMMADMFANLKKDLLLITTPSEKRTCIEVTPSMYMTHGVTYCVDEWMDVDENGEAEATQLHCGDFLIVSDSGVYRVGREEFLETHVLD